MRKIIAVLILFIGINSAFGQNFNLFNRKDDLKNFSAKTTYVVIQGNNSLEDIVLMDAVKQHWHLSPYEFCNMEEFENIKRDTNFFFLMKVDGQFSKEKEPAMEFLTLVKGSENSAEGLNNMYEVLSLPYKPLNDDSGEEFIYTAPFINIIQAHILKVQRNKLSAYIGISAYSDGMNGAEDKEILFAEDDFGFEVTQEMLDEDFYMDDVAYFEWLGSFYGMSAADVMNTRAKIGDQRGITVSQAASGVPYKFYCYYFDTNTGALASDIAFFTITTKKPSPNQRCSSHR